MQQKRRRSFDFGVLRIGLLVERHPRTALIILGLAIAVTIYGFFHISIDRDLRDMFRGETEAYRTYVATTEEFVDPENQFLILLEGDDLTTPRVLDRLFDFHLDLTLLPDVGNVYSLFSLRGPPDADGDTAPLIADPDTGLGPMLRQLVRAHPIMGEALVSSDGSAMLFVVTHAVPKASIAEHRALIAEVEELIGQDLASSGIDVSLTGSAVLRTEIIRLLQRDQIVLNGSGLVIGLILSLFFFRSVTAAVMTAAPAAMAGLFLIGWNGALGVPVTILSNVVPAIIMVIGYADGMHLTSAFRRYRAKGLSVIKAERHAMLEAGPACVLSAVTTVVAFLSMFFSDVRILRDFAIVGSIGTFLGTWIVVLGHSIVTRHIGRFWKVGGIVPPSPLQALSAPIGRLTGWVIKRPWPIAIVAVPLTLLLGTLVLLVPPEYSVRETLPSSSSSTVALGVVDAKLGGAFPIQIVVPVADPVSAEGLAKIWAVHDAVGAVPGVSSPLSLWSLAEWVGTGPEPIEDRVAAVLDRLPVASQRRFTGEPGALVTVTISELPTAETLRLVDAIEAAALAAAPDALVTGSTVVNAREATRTINNLSTSFASAIAITLVLIAFALRSVGAGLVAAIPNVLPIAATGTMLYFLGSGMQITSVLSLTIAFGIAVDDTIHYLSKVLRERGSVRQRLLTTSRDVGPVLVGTTLVICTGLMMTLTSGLATVSNFGLLAIVTLFVAMFGDLFITPALIAGPARRLFEPPEDHGRDAAKPATDVDQDRPE